MNDNGLWSSKTDLCYLDHEGPQICDVNTSILHACQDMCLLDHEGPQICDVNTVIQHACKDMCLLDLRVHRSVMKTLQFCLHVKICACLILGSTDLWCKLCNSACMSRSVIARSEGPQICDVNSVILHACQDLCLLDLRVHRSVMSILQFYLHAYQDLCLLDLRVHRSVMSILQVCMHVKIYACSIWGSTDLWCQLCNSACMSRSVLARSEGPQICDVSSVILHIRKGRPGHELKLELYEVLLSNGGRYSMALLVFTSIIITIIIIIIYFLIITITTRRFS